MKRRFFGNHAGRVFVGSGPNFYGTYRPEALPHSGIFYRISSERHVLSLPEDDRPVLRPDLAEPERMEDLRQGRDLALRSSTSAAAATAGPTLAAPTLGVLKALYALGVNLSAHPAPVLR